MSWDPGFKRKDYLTTFAAAINGPSRKDIIEAGGSDVQP